VEYFTITAAFAMLSVIHFHFRASIDLRYLFVLILFIFALLIGLRGNQDEYTRVFLLVPDFSSFDHGLALEKGYVFYFYSSLLKTLGLGSQYVLAAYAFISLGLYSYYYRKFTPYYYLAFLIYLVHAIQFREMHGIRMGLASALALPIMSSVLLNKKSRFFFLSILSVLIHYVGVLSFSIYFLNKRYSLKLYFFLFIFAILISETGGLLMIMNYIYSLNIFPDFIANYFVSTVWSYDVGIFHPKTIQQIIFCSFYLFLIYYLGIKTDRLSNLIFNMYFTSTILYILFSQLAIFAFRLGSHFYVIEPLLIVSMVTLFKQKRLVYLSIVFSAIGVSYLNYIYLHRVEDYFLGIM
jgi:amylovoran biosynthesis protein AmsC